MYNKEKLAKIEINGRCTFTDNFHLLLYLGAVKIKAKQSRIVDVHPLTRAIPSIFVPLTRHHIDCIHIRYQNIFLKKKHVLGGFCTFAMCPGMRLVKVRVSSIVVLHCNGNCHYVNFMWYRSIKKPAHTHKQIN